MKALSQFLSQKDIVDEYEEWFYPTGEIGHKLLCITKFLVYVMFSTHNMGWTNNQTCMLVSYRFVYILFHGLSKITLVVPFLMFHINFGYLFPAMISFVDKIILINRIHCKCLEQINTLFVSLSRSDWCLIFFLTTCANCN